MYVCVLYVPPAYLPTCLHYIAYPTPPPYPTLPYTTLPYTTLHCTTLHYPTLLYITYNTYIHTHSLTYIHTLPLTNYILTYIPTYLSLSLSLSHVTRRQHLALRAEPDIPYPAYLEAEAGTISMTDPPATTP